MKVTLEDMQRYMVNTFIAQQIVCTTQFLSHIITESELDGFWGKTHSWMPLMRVPNSPIMPRNSTRLRFFTVCSWHKLDTAYRTALSRTRPSPSRTSLPAEKKGSWTYINYKNLRQRGTMTDEIFLTGSLLSFSQEVSPNHGPDPWETHQHSHKVDRLVASLQEEPGEHHQHRDHEAVQQLKHIAELTDENIHLKWWRHISWLQTTCNKHRGFPNQFETNSNAQKTLHSTDKTKRKTDAIC